MNGGHLAHESTEGLEANIEYIPFGFSASMTARVLKNQNVRLDVIIEESKVIRIDDTVRVKKTSLRSIETTRFGETVKLILDRDDDSGGRYQFQIRIVDPSGKK